MPQQGRRREQIPQSCSLTSTKVPWHSFLPYLEKKKTHKNHKIFNKKILTNKIKFSSQAIYWYGTFTGGQSGWAFPWDLCRELPSLPRVFPLTSALVHSLGSNLRITLL